jgi:general secretion pathway protein H
MKHSRRHAARGFTLVEILVVVVIVAILSTGFLLSVSLAGGTDPELRKESDRLFDLMNYAREQSELQTREFGIILQDDNYEFVAYDVHRGIWRSVFEDDVLRLRKLPYGLDLKLMIFSSGDLTQFELTLEREGGERSVTITEDDKGNIIEKPMVDTKESRT